MQWPQKFILSHASTAQLKTGQQALVSWTPRAGGGANCKELSYTMAGVNRLNSCHMVGHAGTPRDPPPATALLDAGVQSFNSEGDDKGQPKDPASQIDSLMSKLENSEESSTSSQPPALLVTIGIGLLALPQNLIARVLANEYINFLELPPAKGKGRPMPQSLEGQVIVVQAAELLQARKIIPDLATWVQCKVPRTAAGIKLMAYQTIIAKASQRYRWPSWVVYDQNFRQEAAGNMGGSGNPSSQGRQEQQICLKYKKFNGDCKFGKECRYLHICSSCREPHPVSRGGAGKESGGVSNQ